MEIAGLTVSGKSELYVEFIDFPETLHIGAEGVVKLAPAGDVRRDVEENMVKTGLAKAVSDSVRDSLTYSGSVLFPFFKNDSPVSMTMPVQQLARFGIVGKECIERWTVLDRWNTVHFPNWNPTSADFLKPKYFYVPFLGCDVHSSRIARIVTAPQPGYWGVMMNMGWGISDIPSWLEAVFNYYNVMQAIPTMISQLSLLARTFNIDGPLAMEGAMVLDAQSQEDTIGVRQASALNPVNLDVVGDLKAIQRDFGQVPELCRLIRQDVAAKAGFLEDALFTVEKKGMGGNDKGEANWGRQNETMSYLYSDVQCQLKPIAMLQVINALGLGRDVLKALPYTEICFNEQRVTNADEKAAILESGTKGLFDLVASGISLPDAAELVEQLSGGLMTIDGELRGRLEERQEMIDEREQEAHDAEMASMQAQTDSAMVADAGTETTESSSTGADGKKTTTKKINQRNPTVLSSAPGKKEGHSYSDPLKQKSMERVSHKGSGTRKQGMQKARNKIKG